VTFYGPAARLPVLAGALSFAIFSLAAWGASPSLPGGDEPHYLVITQSLLRDGDLKIENNHQRGDYRAYFVGDLAPDAVRRGQNGGLYSIHAPGVPALVLPAFAIGGISRENVRALAAAGVRRVAVASGILASGGLEEIRESARAIRAALPSS